MGNGGNPRMWCQNFGPIGLARESSYSEGVPKAAAKLKRQVEVLAELLRSGRFTPEQVKEALEGTDEAYGRFMEVCFEALRDPRERN